MGNYSRNKIFSSEIFTSFKCKNWQQNIGDKDKDVISFSGFNISKPNPVRKWNSIIRKLLTPNAVILTISIYQLYPVSGLMLLGINNYNASAVNHALKFLRTCIMIYLPSENCIFYGDLNFTFSYGCHATNIEKWY